MHNIQIELPKHTDQMKRDDIYELSQQCKQSNKNESQLRKRIYHPLLLYILVMMSQLLTIFLGLLINFTSTQNKKYMYLTFIILSLVRCTIFLSNSIYLIGCSKQLVRLYCLLDNTLLMLAASVITYIFANYQNDIQFALPAMACSPFLLLFLAGNFRVMLLYCNWRPWQVIIYKILKACGSIYCLVSGVLLTITSSENRKNQLLALWIFTACGFWGQMYFTINSFDASDSFNTNYTLMSD